MASVASSRLPARRRLIRVARPRSRVQSRQPFSSDLYGTVNLAGTRATHRRFRGCIMFPRPVHHDTPRRSRYALFPHAVQHRCWCGVCGWLLCRGRYAICFVFKATILATRRVGEPWLTDYCRNYTRTQHRECILHLHQQTGGMNSTFPSQEAEH